VDEIEWISEAYHLINFILSYIDITVLPEGWLDQGHLLLIHSHQPVRVNHPAILDALLSWEVSSLRIGTLQDLKFGVLIVTILILLLFLFVFFSVHYLLVIDTIIKLPIVIELVLPINFSAQSIQPHNIMFILKHRLNSFFEFVKVFWLSAVEGCQYDGLLGAVFYRVVYRVKIVLSEAVNWVKFFISIFSTIGIIVGILFFDHLSFLIIEKLQVFIKIC